MDRLLGALDRLRRATGAAPGAVRSDESGGILEEGPTWPEVAEAVAWGRARTPRVVVVDAEGGLTWAGEGEAPMELRQSG